MRLSFFIVNSLFWTTAICCLEYQFRCGNGNCVYENRVCDGADDCHDNSDENFCHVSSDICPGKFQQCADSPFCFGWRARCDGKLDCPDGTDERNCMYRDCLSGQTKCSHGACAPSGIECCRALHGQCAVSKTSFRTTNKTLVFTSGDEIYAMNPMDSSKHFVEESEGSQIDALTFSAQRNTIFWSAGSDIWGVKIGAQKTERKRLIGSISQQCSVKHMAFDWVTGNFYLVCHPSKVIVCGSRDGITRMLCARLHTFEFSRVISLALDPSVGLMYLVGSVGTRLRVIEARSDGESSELIYRGRSTRLDLLSKVASGFDIAERKLWFLQPSSKSLIITLNLRNREATEKVTDMIDHTASPEAVFSDFGIVEISGAVYAVFYRGSAVQMEHLDLSTDNRFFTLLDANAQPAAVNHCGNLTCEHLCLQRFGGAVCKCDSGYNLQKDGVSCSPRLTSNAPAPEPRGTLEARVVVSNGESRSSSLIHLTYLTVIAVGSITVGVAFWYLHFRRKTCAREETTKSASKCSFSASGAEASAAIITDDTPAVW